MTWQVIFHEAFYEGFKLLVGGDKKGLNQRFFYKRLIAIADDRYASYLRKIKQIKKESKNVPKT